MNVTPTIMAQLKPSADPGRGAERHERHDLPLVQPVSQDTKILSLDAEELEQLAQLREEAAKKMQAVLTVRAMFLDEGQPVRWAETYGNLFRMIVDANPEALDWFDGTPEQRERILQAIEKQLYA